MALNASPEFNYEIPTEPPEEDLDEVESFSKSVSDVVAEVMNR